MDLLSVPRQRHQLSNENLDRSDVYNMKMDIEGVLFDYGHTLAYLPNFERTHKLAAMNVQRLVKDIDGVKAETSRITELINNYAHCPKDVVSIQDEFSQILRMLGVQRFHNENLEEIIRAHAVPYIQRARIRRGAKDLLILLKRNGVKTGIVANSAGAYMMNPVLKRESIFQFFDSIVASVDVGFRKPDPRIFQLALGQLQLNHDNVLMVGAS